MRAITGAIFGAAVSIPWVLASPTPTSIGTDLIAPTTPAEWIDLEQLQVLQHHGTLYHYLLHNLTDFKSVLDASGGTGFWAQQVSGGPPANPKTDQFPKANVEVAVTSQDMVEQAKKGNVTEAFVWDPISQRVPNGKTGRYDFIHYDLVASSDGFPHWKDALGSLTEGLAAPDRATGKSSVLHVLHVGTRVFSVYPDRALGLSVARVNRYLTDRNSTDLARYHDVQPREIEDLLRAQGIQNLTTGVFFLPVGAHRTSNLGPGFAAASVAIWKHAVLQALGNGAEGSNEVETWEETVEKAAKELGSAGGWRKIVMSFGYKS